MALYSYKGIDKTGAEKKGTINADNEAHAKTKVRAAGIMLTGIKEQKSGSRAKSQITFGNAISINDLSLMTRQLATLIKARIQIVESFNALIEQCENPKLKVILSEVRQKVNEGS